MTERPRIFMTGAACCGVSTLGNVLSRQFGVPQLDVDDFYWMPTEPPFRTKRAADDRVHLIRRRQNDIYGWILSGYFTGGWDLRISPTERCDRND